MGNSKRSSFGAKKGSQGVREKMLSVTRTQYTSDKWKIDYVALKWISGSVKIGKNVTIGGQSGFAGHINIGDNVVIAAKSGVTKNIIDNSVVAGFPAIDIKNWKRNIIRERKNGYK